MSEAAISIIVLLCVAGLCGVIAARKRRSVAAWVTLGFFLHVFALLIIILLRPAPSAANTTEGPTDEPLPKITPPPWHAQVIQPRAQPEGYPVGLVGESHYQDEILHCAVGDEVTLLREPGNPHDPGAIVAVSKAGRTIGYIPRDNFLQRLVHSENRGATARILSINRASKRPTSLGVVIDIEIDDEPLSTRPYSTP